jgi:hypothetical protein
MAAPSGITMILYYKRLNCVVGVVVGVCVP